MLTPKQYALLRHISERLSRTGVAPSFEEMKADLGFRSKSQVHRLVRALEARGFVRRLPNRSRAIEVLRMPAPKVLRVALCIPVYGMTHAKFTQSLANMVIRSLGAQVRDAAGGEVRLDLETFMVSSSMLTESRHRLVAEALAWEADWMLWLDADHVFPPDALLRLLAHNLPAVGCNYPRRFAPTAPTAAIASGSADHERRILYTTREKAEQGVVEPVAHLGFGLMLLDMRVFDALQAQAEQAGDGNFLPLFKFEPTANKVGMIGEDAFFFRKLAECGIRPFVDHRLSWEVGHLFETVLTNAHAAAQKEQWAEHMKRRARKFERKAAEIEARAEESLA